jgi:hypothetical protein
MGQLYDYGYQLAIKVTPRKNSRQNFRLREPLRYDRLKSFHVCLYAAELISKWRLLNFRDNVSDDMG